MKIVHRKCGSLKKIIELELSIDSYSFEDAVGKVYIPMNA